MRLANEPKKYSKVQNYDHSQQLEQTKQKILQLQSRIQNNLKQRNSKPALNFFSDHKLNSPKHSLPTTSKLALENFFHDLTELERDEILDYETVYYISPRSVKEDNHESDTPRYDTFLTSGDFYFIKQEQVAYRYELVDKLGHGSFGFVFKVVDHKHNQLVALKVIKNREKFYNQALIEIDILKVVNKADPSSCLIKMLNYFEFRNHIVLNTPIQAVHGI